MAAVCLFSRTGRQLQRYDNMGRRLVVGCIPYRYRNGDDGKIIEELEVLIITSQKGQGMMFPKGGWERDESLEEAALRESIEEAGVIGKVENQLGKWTFLSKSNGTFYEGYMFPLLVKEQLELWPEKNVRQRIWMNVAEAREVCRHWWMKEALDILVERLTSQLKNKEENKGKAKGILVRAKNLGFPSFARLVEARNIATFVQNSWTNGADSHTIFKERSVGKVIERIANDMYIFKLFGKLNP